MRAAQRITTGLVQEWIEHFLTKNGDYNSDPMPGFPDGFENADVLGVQGQFGEIWRKIWKLKKGMWDGADLVGEPLREVLLDMIGHCFLAIDMLDRSIEKPEPDEEEPPAGTLYLNPQHRSCGAVCKQGHTYTGSCALRRLRGHPDA